MSGHRRLSPAVWCVFRVFCVTTATPEQQARATENRDIIVDMRVLTLHHYSITSQWIALEHSILFAGWCSYRRPSAPADPAIGWYCKSDVAPRQRSPARKGRCCLDADRL